MVNKREVFITSLLLYSNLGFGFRVVFITPLIYCHNIKFYPDPLSWKVVFTDALAATVIELLSLFDDNFTIILFSGIMMPIGFKLIKGN